MSDSDDDDHVGQQRKRIRLLSDDYYDDDDNDDEEEEGILGFEDVLWKANIVVAGNSHMVYKNEQNSYGRRLVCAPFSYKPKEIDTTMPVRLEKSRSALCRYDALPVQHRLPDAGRLVRKAQHPGDGHAGESPHGGLVLSGVRGRDQAPRLGLPLPV